MDTRDAVVAALCGHVRRVVIGGGGVIIDLGRRSRLFTGGARDAALLQAGLDNHRRCIWPGCRLTHCQIDHALEWGAGGRTRPDNADPMCAHHNRWKTRGYTTRRDNDGRWRIYRPDHTEITTA